MDFNTLLSPVTGQPAPPRDGVYSDPGGPAARRATGRASHEVFSMQTPAVPETSLGRHSVHMHDVGHEGAGGAARAVSGRVGSKARQRMAKLREFFMKIWV